MKKNNAPGSVISLAVAAKQKAEQVAIAAATSKGHRDPRNHPDHLKILETKVGGKNYRRFIKSFYYTTEDKLFKTQIRLKEVDETYCRLELAPLLQKDGKILDPPFVTSRSNTMKNVEHGHHRVRSNSIAFGKDVPLPVFELDSEFYEIDESGNYATTGVPVAYIQLKSKIDCNAPRESLAYEMTDVAVQLTELFSADPTFNGVNPAGYSFPDRQQFDAVMDDLHPRAFLYKGTRTKIYNAWCKGGNLSSKIKPVTFQDVTADLVNHNLNPGVTINKRKKPVREKFLEHFDSTKNVFIGTTTTNGKTFERDFILPLVAAFSDKTLCTQSGYRIVLHCEVYSPSSTLVKLKQERNSFVDNRLRVWNRRLKALGCSVIFSQVIFPKQLTDKADNGEHIIL